MFADPAAGNLRGLVRQLSIDQFENEGRRVSMGTNSVEKPQRTPLFERHNSDPGVHKASIFTASVSSCGLVCYKPSIPCQYVPCSSLDFSC